MIAHACSLDYANHAELAQGLLALGVRGPDFVNVLFSRRPHKQVEVYDVNQLLPEDVFRKVL